MKTIRQIDLEEVQLAGLLVFFFSSPCIFGRAGAAQRLLQGLPQPLAGSDGLGPGPAVSPTARTCAGEKKNKIVMVIIRVSCRKGQIPSVLKGHSVHRPSPASFSPRVPARSHTGAGRGA